MKVTASELAQLLGGTVEGDPSVFVTRPGKIESGLPEEICFLGNDKYEDYAYSTQASVLMVSRNFVAKRPIKPTLIRVDNVYAALAFLLEKFGAQHIDNERVISKMASIHPSVFLGENVAIGDFVILEEGVVVGDNSVIKGQVFIGKNARIGANNLIYAGVKIYHDCLIGNNAIIHANVVIGADGFGFVPQEDGTYKKITQTGNVIIEDNVEIGANTTIDRASIGSTFIRKGVKLDNLIQIAHNVDVGENTVIAAQAGIAGSTKVGKNCLIGGQVAIIGHLILGDNVQIQGQSGVIHNAESNSKLFGTPAIPYFDYLRSYAVFKNLPKLQKTVFDLEKKDKVMSK
jgi:UDP-3-O-[3-hydroxymyristoyl] glucosamine N-acyltransferase